MGVVTVKSAMMTNRDQAARAQTDAEIFNAAKKVLKGLVTLGAADSATSKYLFFPIPSSARILSAKISCPDIGTSATMDIGIYKSTRDGGAVVDADLIKAAVDIHSGALTKSEIVHGNVITVANMEKQLWQLVPGSLTEDPGLVYDVVGTLAADTDAAGAVFLEIEYV